MAKALQVMGQKLEKAEDISTAGAIKGRFVEILSESRARTARAAQLTKNRSFEIVADRSVQVAAASGLGGAVVVGTAGAGVGLFAGGTVGAAIGLPLALFTLGLSIPVGSAIGGGCGLAFGSAFGGSFGFVGAGIAGYGAHVKRAEIRSLINTLKTKVMSYSISAKRKAVEVSCVAMATVKGTAVTYLGATKEKAAQAAKATKARAKKITADKTVQAATASTVGGAVILGTGGAATGLATGTAIGAAVGLVPAIFTFGLSIPCFALVGGGCGLAAGTAVGGTTGAVAGLGGYCTYTRREAIKSSFEANVKKARDSATNVHARLTGATSATQ